MKPIRVTAQAEEDIARAYHWYEGQREGLGLKFIERVEEAIGAIAEAPLGYEKVIGEGRRANVRRFPFGLWFKVYPDESIVFGCLHARRDAVLARERIKGVIEMPRKPSEPSPG